MLLSLGKSSHKLFTAKGEFFKYPSASRLLLSLTILALWSRGDFCVDITLPDSIPLEKREATLDGQSGRAKFVIMMGKILQWEPSKRSSARVLASSEWIMDYM